MKCQARITKEFKSRKADACWPEYAGGLLPENTAKYQQCLGELNVKIVTQEEPYFGGSDTVMRMKVTCSRCKHPYFDGMLKIQSIPYDGFDLTPYLERTTS